jgi:GAF domain-containing protein
VRRFGFAAVACIPLRRAGTPVGLLLLYSAEPGCFDAELVALAERMAAGMSSALERLDAERRVRDSEARFRSLAHLAPDWYREQDERLRFTRLDGGLFPRVGIDPRALAQLRQGQVLDEDPITQMRTVVAGVQNGNVVIAEQGQIETTAAAYNQKTGAVQSMSLEQQLGLGKTLVHVQRTR